jgi:hypothetical protein
MGRSRTQVLVLCFTASCSPGIAAAQTVIPTQAEIQRSCSEQADRLHLHGEDRLHFRSQCKDVVQGKTPAQVPGSPPENPQGDTGVSNLNFENGALTGRQN